MAKVIADAADVGPRLARTENFCLVAEAVGCLADRQQGVLDGKNRLFLLTESDEIHPVREALDACDVI